jgi:hypothetical protein
MSKQYANVRLSRQSWKYLNVEREPNETLDEVLIRVFEDRQKLRKMLQSDGALHNA